MFHKNDILMHQPSSKRLKKLKENNVTSDLSIRAIQMNAPGKPAYFHLYNGLTTKHKVSPNNLNVPT